MASQEAVKLLSLGKGEDPGNFFPWPRALGNRMKLLLVSHDLGQQFPRSSPLSFDCSLEVIQYISILSILFHVDVKVTCGSNPMTTVYDTGAGMERTRKRKFVLYMCIHYTNVSSISFQIKSFLIKFIFSFLMNNLSYSICFEIILCQPLHLAHSYFCAYINRIISMQILTVKILSEIKKCFH